MSKKEEPRGINRFREQLHEIIFEADTPAGKAFDVALLVVILASVLAVMLETVPSLFLKYPRFFYYLEWGFTIAFTIEYILRLFCVYRPWKYALSSWGIIDLLAILPTYLNIFLGGSNYFIVIRGLRLLRVFRIFKLTKFLKESSILVSALRASQPKITLFLFFVIISVINIGSVMYLVEGGVNPGFSSIPHSIYWAIVTLTTVGYGDISPITDVGRFLAAAVMILGYAVLAVPTGFVSSEIINQQKSHSSTNTQSCRFCARSGHEDDAVFCKYCGEKLNP
jgi:voltage-gated potassium channel